MCDKKINIIGLVAPLPPPYGGMANQALQLSGLLKSEGVDVRVVQVNKAYRPAWIESIKGIRALFRLIPYIFQLWDTAGKVQLFHIFANSGWSWHLFAAPAIWIGSARGIPVIVNYRGGEAEVFFERSYRLVKLSLFFVDRVIVPSGFLQSVFTKRNISTDIIPNIIDMERFSIGTKDKSVRQKTILVSRNLEKIYDNETAIRALKIVVAKLPDVRMIIAGSGPLKSELLSLAVKLGIEKNIEFVGRVENKDMNSLYARSDIMINPSLVDNMPISILEALASGVAVVSTNVGGVPYLVEHGKTALLVPPQQPEAMANAIITILGNSVLADGLVSEGYKLAERYTWVNVKARLWNTYLSVI